MKKHIIILSMLVFASSNLLAPIVRFYYPADKDAKDLWIQIDKGKTEGWTKMIKQNPNGRYEKKQLPSLSSESGKRYIYWKVGNSIYKTRDAYISPEIVTFGKNGITYTVQTSAEELIGKTAKDKDLASQLISQADFEKARPTTAKELYKQTMTKLKAEGRIIEINKITDTKQLKDMLNTQAIGIKNAKSSGATNEDLQFEIQIQKTINDRIDFLEKQKKISGLITQDVSRQTKIQEDKTKEIIEKEKKFEALKKDILKPGITPKEKQKLDAKKGQPSTEPTITKKVAEKPSVEELQAQKGNLSSTKTRTKEEAPKSEETKLFEEIKKGTQLKKTETVIKKEDQQKKLDILNKPVSAPRSDKDKDDIETVKKYINKESSEYKEIIDGQFKEYTLKALINSINRELKKTNFKKEDLIRLIKVINEKVGKKELPQTNDKPVIEYMKEVFGKDFVEKDILQLKEKQPKKTIDLEPVEKPILSEDVLLGGKEQLKKTGVKVIESFLGTSPNRLTIEKLENGKGELGYTKDFSLSEPRFKSIINDIKVELDKGSANFKREELTKLLKLIYDKFENFKLISENKIPVKQYMKKSLDKYYEEITKK